MPNTRTLTRLGQYELVRKLGEGAAGTVYLGRHDLLNTDYAVKILHPRFAAQASGTDRFLREARHAARLSHPNIVRVVSADEHEGTPFIVMDYVPGGSLEALAEEGALEATRAVGYVRRVLDGLSYAHGRGLLHRDVKAENILLGPDDEPQLTDFGLVLHLEDDNRLTAENTVVGTPYYMSPEQWAGNTLDVRSDVFSAGVTLYYLLTGRFPFPGKTPISVLHRLQSEDHEPLGGLQLDLPDPAGLERIQRDLAGIVGTALARQPDGRFATAQSFASALDAWLDGVASMAQPEATEPTDSSTRSPSGLRFHLEELNPESTTRNKTMTQNLAVEPVEIAENTYWVGKRPDDEIFYANPYLRHFPGQEGTGDFNMLIDPGSSSDFSVVQSKVSQILGSIKKVSAVFINHQDPDVGSSVGLMLGRYTPKAHVLCTEDTWRLVQYYNIPRNRFVALEKFPKGVKLPTGDVVKPVPSPFCHFVGAMMVYDPSTRVLFTGDLFGGLTDRDAEGLYADESDWTGMRAFHQIYMPTQKALRNAIQNIRRLDPAPEVIAPQHGRVITGEYVAEYIERLENLPVGLDILNDRFSSDEELQAWTTVLGRVLETARSAIGDQAAQLLDHDPNLSGIIAFTNAGVEVRSLGKTSVERAVRILSDRVPRQVANSLKYEAVFASNELGLPTPMIELDEEGGEGGDAGEDGSSAFASAGAAE